MKKIFILCLAVWPLFSFPTTFPEIGNVDYGSATASTEDNVKTITQTTDKAIITWDSFTLQGSEATLEFSLPNSNSSTLNIVPDTNLAINEATLKSNGTLYLVSPKNNIVLNGKIITTGSFIATTLDINTNDYMNDTTLLHLETTNDKEIELPKDCSITSENSNIILIAPKVLGVGNLTASQGTIEVVGAKKVLLDENNEDLVMINNTSGIPSGFVMLPEDGSFTAGNIYLKANDLATLATLEATGITEKAGKIYLEGGAKNTEVGGCLKAQGGTIEILGDNITIGYQLEDHPTTKVDVSNSEGKGGTINIGIAKDGIGAAKTINIKGFENTSTTLDVSGSTSGGEINLPVPDSLQLKANLISNDEGHPGKMRFYAKDYWISDSSHATKTQLSPDTLKNIVQAIDCNLEVTNDDDSSHDITVPSDTTLDFDSDNTLTLKAPTIEIGGTLTYSGNNGGIDILLGEFSDGSYTDGSFTVAAGQETLGKISSSPNLKGVQIYTPQQEGLFNTYNINAAVSRFVINGNPNGTDTVKYPEEGPVVTFSNGQPIRYTSDTLYWSGIKRGIGYIWEYSNIDTLLKGTKAAKDGSDTNHQHFSSQASDFIDTLSPRGDIPTIRLEVNEEITDTVEADEYPEKLNHHETQGQQ
ncbi:MAG: hypothetical protein ACQEP8_00280 [Chlamydiota bacterium]